MFERVIPFCIYTVHKHVSTYYNNSNNGYKLYFTVVVGSIRKYVKKRYSQTFIVSRMLPTHWRIYGGGS